ncbi:hypothetical protein [Actinomadura napierensis]|uniref:Uncharacterized protein n=1 Tax=Actinomadura napierensis TaxID=267854 RepID=A0ABP5M425_9ACTN
MTASPRCALATCARLPEGSDDARMLAAVPGGHDLLYARVDLIPGPDGEPLLIELELTEPALYLEHAPRQRRPLRQGRRRPALKP